MECRDRQTHPTYSESRSRLVNSVALPAQSTPFLSLDAITWVHIREGRNGKKVLLTSELRANGVFPPGFSLTWHRIGVKRATSALARGSRKTGGCPVRYRRFYTRLVSAPGLGRGSRYRGKRRRRRFYNLPAMQYASYFQKMHGVQKLTFRKSRKKSSRDAY